MKQFAKELINGKYFLLFAIVVLSILKLLCDHFHITIKGLLSIPSFKISVIIFFGAALIHFLFSLIVALAVPDSDDDTYDKWYARNSSKKVYRILNAFIERSYISLSILHYGLAIYLTVSISWLEFTALMIIWILKKWIRYFINRNKPTLQEKAE